SEIAIGSPINLFGLKVGKVDGIRINKDFDGVELRISILDKVCENLTTDVSLSIVPALFGSTELNLDPGESPRPLEEKGTIHVVVGESVNQLIQKNLKSFYNDIIPEVTSGVKNFAEAGENMKNVDFDKFGSIMENFEENMNLTSKFISSLNSLNTDLRDIMIKMDSTMDGIETFTERISGFAENTFGDENNLSDNINKLFTSTETLFQSANVISLKTNKLLETFEKSAQNVNTVSADIIQLTNTLPDLVKSINKMVEDFSIIGLAVQRHWLLKGSVKGVKKQKLIKEKSTQSPEIIQPDENDPNLDGIY
ncbi:MAG: MlaD family protein, partial [Planctomycetota bacterium]